MPLRGCAETWNDYILVCLSGVELNHYMIISRYATPGVYWITKWLYLSILVQGCSESSRYYIPVYLSVDVLNHQVIISQYTSPVMLLNREVIISLHASLWMCWIIKGFPHSMPQSGCTKSWSVYILVWCPSVVVLNHEEIMSSYASLWTVITLWETPTPLETNGNLPNPWNCQNYYEQPTMSGVDFYVLQGIWNSLTCFTEKSPTPRQ